MPQSTQAKPSQMMHELIDDMEAFYEKVPYEFRAEAHSLLIRLVQTATAYSLHTTRIIEEDLEQAQKQRRIIKHLHRLVDNQHRLN